MQPLTSSIIVLSVAVIYLLWHTYFRFVIRRRRLLRERVAYMLWTMTKDPDDEGDIANHCELIDHPGV